MRHPHSRTALILASAVAFAACGAEQAKISDTINTERVQREDLPINVKEGGELVAVNEKVAASNIEGNATILWLIPEGTLVKKGDKLVELDVTELIDKQANQEISVGKAKNEYEQAKTAQGILEKELLTKKNTATSQQRIASMELEKLLGAKDGKGSEGKNADMVQRLQELVSPPADDEATTSQPTDASAQRDDLVAQVHPQNYAGLIGKVTKLLKVEGDDSDPLQRDMGEMANKILQQADQIRLAMADLKVKEDTAAHSRRLAAKQFITRNELERDELAYQSQASKVTIAWNDLELLVNYTLERDKIELKQNVANADLEVERVEASNDAERKNSEFDVAAKKKEFEVATARLKNLETQIGNSIIYSPGDGLVVYSKISRGRGDSDPVEEGTSVRQHQSIIIIPDNSKLKCEIKVQEAMIDKVKVGMPAHISAEVRPNEVLTGRVTYVAPVADSKSRWSGNDKKVYTTYVLLDGVNKDESLKAGMKASATITVDTVPNVLTVPIQAVRRDRAVNYVWKRTPNGPEAGAIKVGANNQLKVEVKEGLQEGDVIYRTPPSGEADPKFDQPEMPEPDPMDKNAAAKDGDSIPKKDEGRSRRGGPSRKKFADMSADELIKAKSDLRTSIQRYGDMLGEEKLAQANRMIDQITKAIDEGELEKADRLRSSMMRKMWSGARGQGGGGNRGRRGGE